ncbi:MAG: hypothetical protein ACM3PS_00745 [Syntrophothermus sp.]
MKIIKNEKLIQRNGRIGVWMSLAALAVLGLGMYISFIRQDLFIYALVALLLGFTMTQIGMYLGNRYSRKPRPDEKLDAGLKGLPGDYTLYHYTTPAPHVLVGPSGVWLLKPYHQHGQVVFRKNRYQMSGGGFVQSYMRIFGQESLGRPEYEIEKEAQSLRKRLAKGMDESRIPEFKPVLVFTSEAVEIDAEGADIPAVKLKQLKDFLRQKAKEEKLPAETIRGLNEALA